MVGHVVSISITNSAAIKFENAIALSKSRFVFNFEYANPASIVMNTARVIPPTCKKICAIWKPCKKWGPIIGKAKIATTPTTTIENRADFLSTILSGLNKVTIISQLFI